MVTRVEYTQVYCGEWLEPKPQRGHKITCCDCGLVHKMNVRIRKGKVQFQAFRDNRATAARRRKTKFCNALTHSRLTN